MITAPRLIVVDEDVARKLAQRIVSEAPGFDMVVTPEQRAQLAVIAPAYERSLQPASKDEIEDAIALLAAAMPPRKSSEQDGEALLEIYAEGLSDIPIDILRQAYRRCVRECQWFPTVKEIRDRCTGLAVRRFELSKIRALIQTHDRKWREPGEAMDEADKQRMKALLAQPAKRLDGSQAA